MTNPSMLRLLWAVIEEMPSHDLLILSDTALISKLLQNISKKVLLSSKKVLLSGEEVGILYGYIGSRISLIRDMADCRCFRNLNLQA